MKDGTEESEQLRRCALQIAADELPAGWNIVPCSPLSRVAVNRDQHIYYKEFMYQSPVSRLMARLRGSRATAARRQNDALRYVGIEAPANLAWGKLPGGSEYLFTRAAAGQDVARWLRTTLAARTGDALTTRRQLLEALGIFIGRVHATGFIPGDLKAGNLLADLTDSGFQFTLVDNEHTVMKLPPPGRMLLSNLMQINLLPPSVLSRTDRMRFFVGWRRQMRELSTIEAKVVAAEAYHWAMRTMYERGML